MDVLENVLRTYGFIGLFVACAVEGDLSLILAGLLVHLGFFGIPETYCVSVAGLTTGDLAFFWLGRRSAKINWVGKSSQLLNKAGHLLDRLGPKAIPAVRIFYGLRNVTFFLCGRRHWKLRRFLSGDIPGALFWSAILIALGYTFAASADAIFGHIKRTEEILVLTGTAILIAFFGGKILWELLFPKRLPERETRAHTV